MALLGRDQILNADDAEFETVPVPEWGGEVRIRGLSGSERDRYEESLSRMKGDRQIPNIVNARARLVAWTVVDENGNKLFADADIHKLGMRSSKALDRVFAASAKLSGISDQDMEEMTEGFGDGQSEEPTSE